MKRLAARLPVALSTFLLSLLVTAALTRLAPKTNASAQNCDKPPTVNATPFVFSKFTVSDEPTPAEKKTPHISQQEVVNFPGIGLVRVTANVECNDYCPELVFEDANTNKFLSSAHFSGGDHALVRFKAMHVKGLPDPLIVGVAVDPGGSDAGWESVAIGAVDGRLTELTSETLNASNQGGFYYGDLGGGRGLGAIGCDFIWGHDIDESHYSAHHYELKIYKWDEKTSSFEWYQVLRTRGKFDSSRKAARSLGFKFADVRRNFGFGDFEADLGAP